jgi:uncharacterized protein (DUF433 family)
LGSGVKQTRDRAVRSAYIGLAIRWAEAAVAILEGKPAIRAEVVSDPTVMSGDPVVRGTRVPAETIMAYLRAGHSPQDIFSDYPSLPIDGIDAVIRWAEATYGADWRSAELPMAGR